MAHHKKPAKTKKSAPTSEAAKTAEHKLPPPSARPARKPAAKPATSDGPTATATPRCPICEAAGTFERHVPAYGNTLDLYHCQGCHSLFFFPQPPNDYQGSYDALATRYYVERDAGIYFLAELTEYIRAMVERSPTLRQRERLRVLEVGCGFGFVLDMGRTLYGWEVLGVEPGAYGKMGSELLGHRIVNTTLSPGMKLPEAPFDIVLSTEVIEHVSDPVAFLQTLAANLADDGYLFLTTPNAAHPEAELVPAEGYHTFILSDDAVRRIGQRAGLAVELFSPSLKQRHAIVAARPGQALPGLSYEQIAAAAAESARRYLELRSADESLPTSLRSGLLFRMFESQTNRGEFAEAAATAQKIEALAYDGDAVAFTASHMPQPADKLRPLTFGIELPFFTSLFLFYRGAVAMHGGDFSRARRCFDLSCELLEVESATLHHSPEWRLVVQLRRLHVLAELDPAAALAELRALAALRGDDLPFNLRPDFHRRLAEARREVFIRLCNGGRYIDAAEIAADVAADVELADGELVRDAATGRARRSDIDAALCLAVLDLEQRDDPVGAAAWAQRVQKGLRGPRGDVESGATDVLVRVRSIEQAALRQLAAGSQTAAATTPSASCPLCQGPGHFEQAVRAGTQALQLFRCERCQSLFFDPPPPTSLDLSDAAVTELARSADLPITPEGILFRGQGDRLRRLRLRLLVRLLRQRRFTEALKLRAQLAEDVGALVAQAQALLRQGDFQALLHGLQDLARELR